MSTAETPKPSGFEVVVGDDGGISPETLARYGLNRPGMHLRLLAENAEGQPRRKSALGILRGKIDVEGIEEGLRQAKAERIAATE